MVFDGSYSVEMLPPQKIRPFATYKHKDGRVVHLPADPYSLNHYLKKGLVLVNPVETNDKPPKKRGRPRKGGKT